MSRQPSLTELEEALFDPLKDPLLTPGFVTPEYYASEAEERAAAKLLAYRREHYGWRLDPLPEPVVGAVERSLAESEAAIPSGSMAAQLAEALLQRNLATGASEGSGQGQAGPSHAAAAEAEAPDAEDLAARARRRTARGLPWRPLPFYPGGRLIHVLAEEEAGDADPAQADRVLLFEQGADLRALRLEGDSEPIHMANTQAPFDPDRPGALEEYVDFFCLHLHTGEAAFFVIEEGENAALDETPGSVEASGELVVPPDRPLPQFYNVMRDYRRAGRLSDEEQIRFAGVFEKGRPVRARLAQPITRLARKEGDNFLLLATLIFGSTPFRAVFAVRADGLIEMLHDREIRDAAIRPLTPQWLPKRA